MRKALVVLSGGQDSTTCLFWAKKQFDEVHAITFDYGQRHSLEVSAALRLARLAKVASHECVNLGAGVLAGMSPLVNRKAVLETYKDFKQMDEVIGDRVELTFVPLRNPLFLTVAANRAICAGASTLVTGVCEADNANYPDCREVFVNSMQDMINKAMGLQDFKIEAPLLHHSKAQTVAMMYDMGRDTFAMLAFTHTSYDGEYPPTGMNHANVLRAEGFRVSGLPDPLVLRAWSEGLMPIPGTANYDDLALNANLVAIMRRLAPQAQVAA